MAFGVVAGVPVAMLLEIVRAGFKTTLVTRGKFTRKIDQFQLISASLSLSASISESSDSVLRSRLESGADFKKQGRDSFASLFGGELSGHDDSGRLFAKHKRHCAETIVRLRHKIHHTAIVDALRTRCDRSVQRSVFTACFVFANTEGLEMKAMRTLAAYALGFGIPVEEFISLLNAEFRLDAAACSVLGIARNADMPAIERAYRTRSDRTLEQDELARVAYHKVMDQLVALDDIVAQYRHAFAGYREDM